MDAATTAFRRVENVPRGIVYMIGATLLFALSSVVVKWQLAIYPPGEVAFFRQAFSFVFCAITILPATGLAVFRSRRRIQHVARGGLQFTAQMCMVMALSLMPLGSAMSISFSAPLFAALISVVIFGERVGIHRTAALIVGFGGVLLVTEPSGGAVEVGAMWALANAVLYASVNVTVRRMSATESAETLTMYQMVVLTILMAGLLPFGFEAPEWWDVVLLGLAGYANGLGQVWWTRSLSMAPPTAVMPYYYMSLVWAMLFGFIVWHEIPTLSVFAGAGVVMISGLYLIWREDIARKRAAQAKLQAGIDAQAHTRTHPHAPRGQPSRRRFD